MTTTSEYTLHGWGGSGRYFDGMLQYLDLTGLRVGSFDWRGHGDSNKAEHGYTLERFTRDALTVADAAGMERFIAVGYSMAGKFAQHLTCHAPERVLGQVLIAPAYASAIVLAPEVQRAWVAMAGNGEAFAKQLLPQLARRQIRSELLESFLRDFVKVPAIALDETLNMCKVSFAEAVSAIRVPTLVIGGRQDLPLFGPEALRQAVVSPIPGARLALLDCGHEIPHEMPGETAALIEAFVAGLGEENQSRF